MKYILVIEGQDTFRNLAMLEINVPRQPGESLTDLTLLQAYTETIRRVESGRAYIYKRIWDSEEAD